MKNVTRRSFVKGSALAGAGAAALGLAASGGSGAATTESGDKKKILRFGQANAKEGMDMQKSTNSVESSISESVCEAPLRWNEDNELVTCLLEEIPTFESDGVTLHCKLKQGVKFHDGSELTSKDIKYTFERMMTPSTGAKSTYMYDMIVGAKEMLAGERDNLDEGITCEDDYNFTFHIVSPMVTYINNLGIS